MTGCCADSSALVATQISEVEGRSFIEGLEARSGLARIDTLAPSAPGRHRWTGSRPGLGSTGINTNGYTLARKIVFESMGLSIDDEFPGSGRSVADVLLDVHRSYLPGLSDA